MQPFMHIQSSCRWEREHYLSHLCRTRTTTIIVVPSHVIASKVCVKQCSPPRNVAIRYHNIKFKPFCSYFYTFVLFCWFLACVVGLNWFNTLETTFQPAGLFCKMLWHGEHTCCHCGVRLVQGCSSVRDRVLRFQVGQTMHLELKKIQSSS